MALPVVIRALAGSRVGSSKDPINLSAEIDSSQLQALSNKIIKLGPNNVHIKSGLNKIAVAWVAKIRLNFRNSTDPYGEAWAPISHRKGQPLIDTGELRDSIDGSVNRLDIELSSPLDYAYKHNYGIGITKRSFLPDNRGLPKSWEQEYVKIMQASILRAIQ